MRKELELLLSTLEHLEKYPSMYLMHKNFVGLSNFLNGYIVAISEVYDIPYSPQISNWLAGRSNNVVWFYYILAVEANNDEEKAYRLLTERLKEFIKQYPHPN